MENEATSYIANGEIELRKIARALDSLAAPRLILENAMGPTVSGKCP